MMHTKPMASLSPTLLARKGQARPAMRRQGLAGYSSLAQAGDDLGWNDMGDAAPDLPAVLVERRRLDEDYVSPPADELPLETPVTHDTTPAPVAAASEPDLPEPELDTEPEIAAPQLLAAVTAAAVVGDAAPRRAAFTLRLDPERHLKLRLATAARGRSAQKLVIQALDAFLATQPDVAALHAQLAGADQPIVRGK